VNSSVKPCSPSDAAQPQHRAGSGRTGWVSEPDIAGARGPLGPHLPLATPSRQRAPCAWQPAAKPGPAQKQHDENHLPDIQGLRWKKCVQFSYCGRIPCGQTAGLYHPSVFQMTFLDDDVHFSLKGENIGITTEELSPPFTLLKGTHICYFPND